MPVSALLSDERCIVLQPDLVRRLGNMHDAAILQQLHYWMPRATSVHDGHRWVYKTYEEWGLEVGLTAKQARQAVNRLEALGVVLSCQPEHWTRRKWYRIWYDHPVLSGPAQTGSSICPDGQDDLPRRAVPSAQEGSSKTEITAEITTEITAEDCPTPSAPGAVVVVGDDETGERLAECRRLADLFADLIEQNGSRRPRVTNKWVQTLDRMIRLDGRTASQVENAMRWCQADEFWRANVLSPDALRKQYERLRLQAQREQRARGGRGLDGVREFLDALGDQ
jgi:hypothetical protein